MLRNLPFFANGWSLWPRAFAETSATLTLCLVVVGSFVLPYELKLFRSPRVANIVDCVPLPDGKSFIAIVGSRVAANHKIETSLLQYDLARSLSSQFPAHPILEPRCINIDRSGMRLFAADSNPNLCSIDLQGTREAVPLFSNLIHASTNSLACTAHGQIVVTLDGNGLHGWNVESNADDEDESILWSIGDESIDCFALCPDSHLGVFGRKKDESCQLLEFNVQTGLTSLILDQVPFELKKLLVSPDGKFLVGVMQSREVLLLKRDTVSEQWQPYPFPPIVTGATYIACFSPQSNLLVTNNVLAKTFVAWDLKNKTVKQEFRGLDESIYMMGCKFIDNDHFLSWVKNTVLIWKLDSIRPVRTIELQ